MSVEEAWEDDGELLESLEEVLFLFLLKLGRDRDFLLLSLGVVGPCTG